VPEHDPYLRNIEAVIAAHGHAVQYVGDSQQGGPAAFAYTVGLHTRPGHDYELAATKLGSFVSRDLLNAVADIFTNTSVSPADEGADQARRAQQLL